MAMSFNTSSGGWISDSTQKNGSSSKNNYGFYIGVKETRVGSSTQNTSDIAIQIAIVNDNVRFATGGWKFRYTVDGQTKEINDGVTIYSNSVPTGGTVRPITFDNSGNTTLNVLNIPHNEDGSKTVSIKVEMYKDSYTNFDPGYCVVNTTFDLTKIARQVEITNFTVSKVDETSVKLDYSTNRTCDYAWYSIDGGNTWNTLDISNTISGLSAGTGYNFKIKVRGTESQLVSESGTYYQATYDYPKPTNIGDFTIGDILNTYIDNPLNRTYTLQIISNNNGDILGEYTGTINGYVQGFNDESSVNRQYASIPNSKTGTCYAKVTYGSSVKVSSNATYSIRGDEIPIFDDFLYQDDDPVQSLVGNNQILVAGYSDCKFTMPQRVRAIARCGASIIKYGIYWGDAYLELPYSDTEDISGYLYDQSSSLIKVVAVDSRGLTKEVSKTVPIIPYSNGIITNLSTERENGISAKTFLGFSVSIADINWNLSNDENYKNRLKYVNYRVKNGSTWGEYQNYNLLDTIADKLKINMANGRIIYTLDLDSNIEIHANGINNGFEIGKEYEIELLIKDGNNTVTSFTNQFIPTAKGTITDGKVGMSRYKDSNGEYHYGINGMPDKNYTLTINGTINGNIIGNKYDWLHPVGENLLFFGDIEYTQGRYVAVMDSYSLIDGFPPIKKGYQRFFRMKAWTNDNIQNGYGLEIDVNDQSNNYAYGFLFGVTWGSGNAERGSYKYSTEFLWYNNVNIGWSKLLATIPKNASGTTGHLFSLSLVAYDIPDGIDPNNM